MPDRNTSVGTHVFLPLSPEMSETLKKLLMRAATEGYGQITITITPQQVKIVNTTEHRFAWV